MNSFKKTLLATAVLAAATTTGVAHAEVTANIGVTSDYVWRGVSQSGESASVSGGIDYADDSGFYAGTWVGSLSGGSELDLYFGYSGEAESIGYDFGYIYYVYPSSDPGINFGEIYGSVSASVFTAGLAITTNNDGANDGAGFESGDLYYYINASGNLSDTWTIGFTIGAYTFDSDGSDILNEAEMVIGELDLDYIHYSLDFGTSTDVGDFTFSLTASDLDEDNATFFSTGNSDPRAVVSWGKSF